jgi:adenosylcobinamide-phosphate synthase
MSSASVPAPTLALIALVIEAAVGWPAPLYAAIGHPVTWIGSLISALDRTLNRESDAFARRRAMGVVALVALLAVPGAVAFAIVAVVERLLPGGAGLLVVGLLAASLPAQRSLDVHVRAVADALDRGIEEGRRAVGMIVGRDTAVLDEPAVARAAIESLAENFSDGIVAPVVWTTALGFVGGVLYKAANTADSMIGHKNDRFLAFGWAAARFDDLINLPASRLAGIWLVLAATVTPGASAADALRAIRRDAHHHTSPNAGWPESAMAGALGFALAGPRVYGGVRIEAAFMGDGRRDLSAVDIRRALRLYRTALVIEALALIVLALALGLH